MMRLYRSRILILFELVVHPKIQDGGKAHAKSFSRFRDRYREVYESYVEDYGSCMKNRKSTLKSVTTSGKLQTRLLWEIGIGNGVDDWSIKNQGLKK